MRNKTPYLILLALLILILFVQCVPVQENKIQDQPDFLFYTTRINDLSDKNITWLYEEGSQSVFYETKADPVPSKAASRKIVGYYQEHDAKFFVTTQVEQYAHPIQLSDFEKIDYGLTPDFVLAPNVISIGLEQRVECAKKDPTDDIKYGYNVCTVQVHLDNNYLFSVFLHGDGRVTIKIMEEFLNEILNGLKTKLKI